MGLAIVIIVGFGLLIADAAVSAHRRAVHRRLEPADAVRRAPAVLTAGARPGDIQPTHRPAASPETVERVLTARLLDGALAGPAYRDRMADIAATVDCGSRECDALRVLALDMRSLELLGRLGPSLPELEPATLCAAVNLARYGAGADDLVRLLDLTYPQALRISAATPRAGRRD